MASMELDRETVGSYEIRMGSLMMSIAEALKKRHKHKPQSVSGSTGDDVRSPTRLEISEGATNFSLFKGDVAIYRGDEFKIVSSVVAPGFLTINGKPCDWQRLKPLDAEPVDDPELFMSDRLRRDPRPAAPTQWMYVIPGFIQFKIELIKNGPGHANMFKFTIVPFEGRTS